METAVLTDVLGALVNAASTSFDSVRQNAEGILYKLLLIELVLFGIGVALNRIDITRELVTKVIAIGFVQFLLFRYVWLVDGLRDGFISTGLIASGSHLSIPEFLDPSAFMDVGFDKIYDTISAKFSGQSVWNFLTKPSAIWIFYIIVLILMFFSFAAVGLQVFLSVAEFYLVSSLAIIFIPFMVLQRTSFLGLRAINGLLAICIKLMVVAFIAGLSAPVIELLAFTSTEPSIKQSMSLAIGALAIALLMWRAPSIALSLISGTGGSDAGSGIISPVLKGANLVGGAGQMLGGAARIGRGALNSVSKAANVGGMK